MDSKELETNVLETNVIDFEDDGTNTNINSKSAEAELFECAEDAKGSKNKWPSRKHFMIVQEKERLTCDIQKVIGEHTTIKQWAYILHDKDDTREHYHIYVNFGRASVSADVVAKWFGIEPQYVRCIKKTKATALMYLYHGLKSCSDKYQYDVKEVVANFDFQLCVKMSEVIGDFERYSYAKQLQLVYELPRDERLVYFRELKKQYEMYCQMLTLKKDRDIKVVFVTGAGGVGKTYYAKKHIESKGFDYAEGSSSNDVLQDYLGQKALLLNDLRDTAFKFEDILKFLDNHTGCSTKSRFNNKSFNGELIVITSATPIDKWYASADNFIPPVERIQLYRRISAYVVVERDYVFVYSELDKFGKPTGYMKIFENDVPKIFKKTEEEKSKTLEEFTCFGKEVDFLNTTVPGLKVLTDRKSFIN